MKINNTFKSLLLLVLSATLAIGCGVTPDNEETNVTEQELSHREENAPSTESAIESTVNNTPGNSNGNLVNGGAVAMQDDWLYFSTSTGLHKMNTDGSNIQKLCSGYNDGPVYWINVVDDWVYFGSIGLYKIKTDGSEYQQIDAEDVRGVHVMGDWIYYGSEYRMKTDGSDKQQLSNRMAAAGYTINVVDDWIYFADKDENEESVVYKMRVDGSDKKVIYDGRVDYMIVDGDWIYYVNYKDNNLYKMTTDGLDNQLILKNQKITNINVSDNWIYYRGYYDDTLSLCKVQSDGSNNQLLCADNAVNIQIIDNYIYYHLNGDPSKSLYRIKTDGSDRILFDVSQSQTEKDTAEASLMPTQDY